ncbi:MAG: PaaI family thioesterase [bacterium]
MAEQLVRFHEEVETLLCTRCQGVQIPPNCFTTMQGKFLQYESRTALTTAFPVLNETLNPIQTMQGGFIAAAFDNTFGPLTYLAARALCVTIDLHTQFIRTIEEGDTLIISAKVISRGPATIVLSAEAQNSKGKLIATASATAMIVKDRSEAQR